MTFRNLLIAATLLVISGCGCNDDTSPPGSTPPVAIPAVLGVKTRVPPIPVPPPTVVQPFKIDVAFIMDDGDHMLDKVLGILPDNQPNDKRTRMQAAQAIFRNVEANIQTQFEAEWVAQHPGTTPPPIDLAFAVARFEDFGGSFAETRNRGNAQDPDITTRNNDRDTRPFILNMPILRQAHPDFGTYFADAIAREAPGDGHPFFELFQGTFARAVDPQSGIEALWQIAAPTAANGDIGGFDADGNGTTLGSGAPTTQGVGCVVEIPIGTVNGGPFQAGEDITFAPSGAQGVALENTADGATVLRYIITEIPNDPENDTTSPAQAGDTVVGLLSGTTTTTTAEASLVDVNPQTCPGATGDVPAVRFQPYPAATLLPAGTNAAGQDDDGEPLFQIADENGTPVSIPNPAGGAAIPSPASGNIGQVGWRPEAARFAILSSSLATVAPTETTPQGTPELPGLLPPPADTELVTSTAGAPDAPREQRDVLLGAFDGGPLLIQGTPFTQRRTGVRGSEVAPTGAHTVNETIARLNELDIEVLFLGTPIQGGLDTKPGITGVNGDIDSNIEGDKFDPTDATKVRPDFAPWFWMNATNTLTMPPVTSIPKAGRTTPTLFGGDSSLFWGVYNMGDVWRYNPADPTGMDESTIRAVLTDDLAERIVAWIDGGYITGGTTPGVRPPLPTVAYDMTLVLGQGGNPDVIQVAPAAGGVPTTSFTQTVQIPTYWSDEAAPADLDVIFPLPADGPFQYAEANDMVPLPATDTIPFEMTATFTMLGNMLPENVAQQQFILSYIVARGDGFTVDGMGKIVPLTAPTDTIIQAQASFSVTVRDSLFPGPGGQLSAVTRGCAIINDLTPNQDSSDQAGGLCPFPPPPVP